MSKEQTVNGGREIPAPGPDVLADCLLLMAKRHGRGITREAMLAGLPLRQGRLTPSVFVRAAERMGFSARLVRRRLKDINPLVLPCVLLLTNSRACILNSLSEEGGPAQVQWPESNGGASLLERDKLAEIYVGYAIFMQPIPDLEDKLGATFISDQGKGSWFWRTLFRYRGLYTEVALASLLINIFVLASPLFIMNVYDRVVPNQAEYTLWVFAIGIIIVYVFDFFVKLIRAHFINLAGKRADVVLASKIYAQLLNLQMKYRPASAGSLAHEVREFETVRDFFSSATLAVILDLPFLLLFLVVIWILSGPVVVVPALAVPVVILVGYFVQRPMDKMVKTELRDSAARHSFLVETINLLEIMKALGLATWGQDRWERAVSLTARSSLQTKFLASLGTYFAGAVMQLVTVGVVIVGFYSILSGSMTMGGLVAATILTGRALAPLSQIASLMTRLQRTRAALAGLDKIMHLPVEREPKRQYLSRPVVRGDVALRGVTFNYPGQKVPALENINLHVRPGERVGLLGEVGSGKSTLHKLILGLYPPDKGVILLDGVEIGQMDPVDVRAGISYLPQSNALFGGTVRENLMAVNPTADDHVLIRAVEASGLADTVARHPAGLDMPVGELGGQLSGGQRQLVAVARSLMRDAPVWLWDEPTNSLDNKSEAQLIGRLGQLVVGRTLLLITHRLPLLKLVERLILLDNGRVVADGPRNQVLEALSRQNPAGQSEQGPGPDKLPRGDVLQAGGRGGAA